MPLRRGPGLVRTVGRTAVIAGTATAVSGRVANRQAEKAAAKEYSLYRISTSRGIVFVSPRM